MHISGEDNCWGDLLSPWRKVGTGADGGVTGSVGCRNIALCASAVVKYALPSKSAMKSSQLRVLAAEGPVDEVTTSCGTARCDTEGLFRV